MQECDKCYGTGLIKGDTKVCGDCKGKGVIENLPLEALEDGAVIPVHEVVEIEEPVEEIEDEPKQGFISRILG